MKPKIYRNAERKRKTQFKKSQHSGVKIRRSIGMALSIRDTAENGNFRGGKAENFPMIVL